MGNEYKQDFFNSSWLQDWLGNINEAMEQWNDPQKNVGEKARTVFWTITSPAWEGILAIILSKVTEAWQALYGIAFIFTGIAAPMAATASLFTSNTFLASAYALWLTGTFTIFLARLLLYIGYGLASDLMVSADASVDTIWFGVVMALVIPFCVFEIAKGGGAGVWSSLVGTASAAISVGTTLAGAAVGGPAGAAAASKVSMQSSSPPPANNVQVETRY